MNVNLIYKLGHNNEVPNAVSKREVFQRMNTIQVLRLIYKDKGNLEQKIKEEYMKDP